MTRHTRTLEKIVIDKGDKLAAENRAAFNKEHVLTLNLIGAPGCGKTTLLERTIAELQHPAAGGPQGLRVGVIEGDIQTTFDRDRIIRAGAPAVQIETEGACRLDAEMVAKALRQIPLDQIDILVIENVGNLICPCGSMLGEHLKVAVHSTPEGDEKPAKYPAAIVHSDAAVFTKIDLLPHLDYDLQRAVTDCRKLNNKINVFPLSAKTGEGMGAWLDYLRRLLAANNSDRSDRSHRSDVSDRSDLSDKKTRNQQRRATQK